MYYSRRKFFRKAKSRVEIIPLIDVMFLLLCFFIYTTMNMVVQKGISVDLAASETSEGMSQDKEQVILSVDSHNRYYANDQVMSESGLTDYLTHQKSQLNSTYIVNADQEASHGQVIKLLDLIRQSGIEEAVFSVEPKELK